MGQSLLPPTGSERRTELGPKVRVLPPTGSERRAPRDVPSGQRLRRQLAGTCMDPHLQDYASHCFPRCFLRFLRVCPHNGLLFFDRSPQRRIVSRLSKIQEIGRGGGGGASLGQSLLPPTGSERRTEPGPRCAYCRLRGRSDAHLGHPKRPTATASVGRGVHALHPTPQSMVPIVSQCVYLFDAVPLCIIVPPNSCFPLSPKVIIVSMFPRMYF